MVYRIGVFIMGLFLVSAISQPVFAVAATGNYGLEETAKHAQYKDEANPPDIFGSVQRVVSVFLALLGILFFILTTYAGIRWMSSRGNEEISLEAKNTLESAVIGLVVIISSYGITSFVFSKLESGESSPEDNRQLTSSCQVATDETMCKVLSHCFWSRPARECKPTALEVGTDSSTSPDWCVVVKNAKEVYCEAANGSCPSTMQGFTQAEVDANFVCPFYGASITTCPAFDQEHCERVVGCGWAGDTCAFKADSTVDITDNGLAWACNDKETPQQCAYDSKCIAMDENGRAGCVKEADAVACIAAIVDPVRDVCDKPYTACTGVCAVKLNDSTDGCYAECNQLIVDSQKASCNAQCDVKKTECDDLCFNTKTTCTAGFVSQKDDCIVSKSGFYN